MNGLPVLELFGLAVLAGGGWLWLDSLRARDIGIAAARAACEAEGLQLLDDTVSIGSLKPARNEDGQLLLRRVYTFEYSDTGDNRRSGSVVLLGHRVMLLNVGLRPAPAYTLH
ncbi:MAG: DUF3301 domain-containing protein [Rhodocyclaceae bacterium]|jgi:hypothetical protein|nr:DUF3301 domain-containing protein [Rhodocyclaceae bacterium]MCZ7654682.1 DUF3301 domain-containing protein [Rhodocyclaceae bacterium]